MLLLPKIAVVEAGLEALSAEELDRLLERQSVKLEILGRVAVEARHLVTGCRNSSAAPSYARAGADAAAGRAARPRRPSAR